MAPGSPIGRDRELDEIATRLRGSRLTTIVGPGGVGKTTLARAVAEHVADGFPLGVLEVDLARVEHAHAVAGAVAAQLGFDSFESLLSSPADQPALLLIDNCEHLLDAVASSIVQVLGACRQPTVLATSRSPLELPGESVVSVAPLPVPRPDDDPLTFASVQLFLARVRDAGADPTVVDLATVGELCRRLDGLPLALEIAAARARTLTVDDIVRGLDERHAVLDRPRFRGAPRHRSVDDAIRWSYDLLPAATAHFLDRLAVFAGPFGVASAQAVNDCDQSTAERALDELVAASLVGADTHDRVARYRLLDTVRRFAMERLRTTDAVSNAFDRFADHVVATLGATVADAATTWRPGLVRDLIASFDDIAEALRWCVEHDESPRRAFALCAVMWGIAHQARADDIADLVRSALDRWPDRGTQTGAIAVASLATAEYSTGNPARAVAVAESALGRLGAVGTATVPLHRVLGQSRRALGDLDGAVTAFRAGAAAGHELGLTAMALELDIAAAVVVADMGDVTRAERELHEVIRRGSDIDSALTVAWARTALGWLLIRTDPSSALPVIDRALHESIAIDYPIAIAAGLRSRAYAELLTGDPTAAVATAGRLTDDLLRRGAHSNARLILDVAALLAHHNGHPAWERLLATARAAPITTLLCAHHEVVPLPRVDGAPLPTRDAVRLVRHVLVELAEAPSARQDRADARPPDRRIRRRGDVVEFGFGGHTAAVRSSKGVIDIIRLIEAQGREVHCVELAGVSIEQASTGEVIDAAARRRYEQRIRDLQAEIDEAEGHGDYARTYRHQAELDALIDHLTAALGQGQRTRRSADSTERARSAVTHRVRAAVRQIASVHPALGTHLGHAVNTGVYCSYRPEQPTAWVVE